MKMSQKLIALLSWMEGIGLDPREAGFTCAYAAGVLAGTAANAGALTKVVLQAHGDCTRVRAKLPAKGKLAPRRNPKCVKVRP
jgi:hypothetical protein